MDEGNSFFRTKEFADVVKNSDDYFVIISRESLPQLPYSIDDSSPKIFVLVILHKIPCGRDSRGSQEFVRSISKPLRTSGFFVLHERKTVC